MEYENQAGTPRGKNRQSQVGGGESEIWKATRPDMDWEDHDREPYKDYTWKRKTSV